jgi:transposase-like protein
LSSYKFKTVLDWLGVDRCHQAIWYWKETLAEKQSDPMRAAPSRVAVDEKQIEVGVFSCRRTDPTVAFLHRLTEKHNVSDTGFLVDACDYLTALSRQDLSGQLNYHDRNHIEKWFQMATMRINRFHSFWRGSQASAKRWLKWFRHYYNRDRPNQALDGRAPAEEVLN